MRLEKGALCNHGSTLNGEKNGQRGSGSLNRDGSGDREEWLGGDFGGYSLLNGSNSLFLALSSILGECPPTHEDFAGVRICVYFGRN